MRGRAVVLAGMIGAFLAAPALAHADHHFVSIREVYPGSTALPASEFVELQMYASGQHNMFPAGSLQFFGSSGLAVGSTPIQDVANGANQRSVLIGTTAAGSQFAVAPDTVYPSDAGLMSPAGGAVCFQSSAGFGTIDCIAWGSITGPPAGAGTPAPAILDGNSLLRSIAAGCATLLEPSDDTDSSLADFSLASPSPRANATTPTEQACVAPPRPETTITKKPPKRTTKRRAGFAFASSINPASFACSIDTKPFKACESPFRTPRLKPGRHTFRAKATAEGQTDPTPASYRWRIVRG